MSEIDILNPSMLGVIFTFVIGIFATSQKWILAKSKLKSVQNVIKEIELAIADDKITPEETKRIIAAIKGVIK